MNNKKSLVIVLILVFLFTAVYFIFGRNNKNVNLENNPSPKQNGLFASVKDALSQKLTLTCEFSNDDSTVKSYIKNGAVRVSSTDVNGNTSEFIQKDNKMYVWDSKTKQGFVYSINNQEDENNITNEEVVSADQYLGMIDQYKDSCKVDTVADSYFTIPSDITFQDMDKFLEDLKSQMPTAPNN